MKTHLRTAIATAAIAAAIAAVGCRASAEGPSISIPAARSDKPRNTAPLVSADDSRELATGNTKLALDLYGLLRNTPELAGKNLFFSPYSVSVALAMTSAGARGATRDEMAKALHFTLPDERLHPAFDALDLALASRGANARSDSRPFRLRVVNADFAQQGLAIEPSFLDVLATSYGADVKLVDFSANPEGARTTINSWVSQETNDRIADLLPPGSISTAARLVLVNAVYFSAGWLTPFAPEATHPAPFQNLDGSSRDVDTMDQTTELKYAKGTGYEAVELPYDGEELSMVIVLPEAGKLADVEGRLTSDELDGIASRLQSSTVHLRLPKLRYEADAFSLAKVLEQLGMRLAFTPQADFSGITRDEQLQILDVFHKAFLAVDESGTEAAAATAVIVGKVSAPVDRHDVFIDRPFVLFIRDRATGTILFAGRFVQLG